MNPFQRILDTQDMGLVISALDLTDRMIMAQAELLLAQSNKGRILLLGGSEVQLHAANERIFRVEDEIEQIYHIAATLMMVVNLAHAGTSAARFAGPPPVFVTEVIVIDLGPEG